MAPGEWLLFNIAKCGVMHFGYNNKQVRKVLWTLERSSVRGVLALISMVAPSGESK